jgi:hypothetical protein
MGVDFPVTAFVFYAIKKAGNHFYPVGVSNKNNSVGQMLRFGFYMIYTPIRVQYKLRRWYYFPVFHE